MEVLGVKLEPGIKEGAAVECRAPEDRVTTTRLVSCWGGAIVVRRMLWDGVAIIGELVRVGGVTDVERRVLRDKVAIVVGLVLVEGEWARVRIIV